MTPSFFAALSYGTLAIIGGILGYIKSRSKISLISGSLSGVFLTIGALAIWHGQLWGSILAAGITALLVIVFILRWWKTRKIMPAGLMVILGAIALVIMVT